MSSVLHLLPHQSPPLITPPSPPSLPGPPSQLEVQQLSALGPAPGLMDLLRDTAKHCPTQNYDDVFRDKFASIHPDACALLREMLRFNAAPPPASSTTSPPPLAALPEGWAEMTDAASGRTCSSIPTLLDTFGSLDHTGISCTAR